MGARRPTAPARCRLDERPCVVGSRLHAFLRQRVVGEVRDQIIGMVERGVPDQLRAQLRCVVVARNLDERERHVGAEGTPRGTGRWSSAGRVREARDVRVAIGAVVEPPRQRDRGLSGDDRVMTTPAGARAKPVRGTRATSVVSSDATTRGDGLGLVGSDRTLISSRITTGRQALADGRGCGGTVRPLRPARRRESGSPGVRSARQRVVQDRAGQGFAAAPALFGALSEPDVRFRRQVANRDAGQDRLLQRSREQWLRAITCSTSLVPARLEVGAQLGIGVVLWNNCCGPPSLDRDDSPSASVIQTPESGSRRRDEARGATRRTLERWPFDCQPDCQPFRLLPAVFLTRCNPFWISITPMNTGFIGVSARS